MTPKALHSSRSRRGAVVNARSACYAPSLLFSLALRLQFRRYAAPLNRWRDEIRDGVDATDRRAGLSFSFDPSCGKRVHPGLRRRGRKAPPPPPATPPPPPPPHPHHSPP